MRLRGIVSWQAKASGFLLGIAAGSGVKINYTLYAFKPGTWNRSQNQNGTDLDTLLTRALALGSEILPELCILHHYSLAVETDIDFRVNKSLSADFALIVGLIDLTRELLGRPALLPVAVTGRLDNRGRIYEVDGVRKKFEVFDSIDASRILFGSSDNFPHLRKFIAVREELSQRWDSHKIAAINHCLYG